MYNFWHKHRGKITICCLAVIAAVTVVTVVRFRLYDGPRFYASHHDMSLSQLKDRGNAFIAAGKPDSALVCYSLIINAYNPDMPPEDKKLVCGAYNNSGYVYYFFYYDYTQAYKNFLLAREIGEEVGYNRALGQIWLNTGNLYFNYHEIDKSTDCYKKALQYSYAAKDTLTILITYINLFAVVYPEGKLSSITPQTQAMLHMKGKEKYPLGNTIDLMIRAVGREDAGDIDGAVELLRQSRDKIDIDLMADRYAFWTNRMIVYMYMRHGHPDKGLSHARENVRDMESKHLYDMTYLAYSNMADLYETQGMMDSARIYRLKAYEVSDSLFTAKKFGYIKDVDASYRIQRVNREMRELSQKKQIQQTVLTLVSIGTLIILVLFFMVLRRGRKLAALHESIYNQLQERLALEVNVSRGVQDHPSEEHEKYRNSSLDSNDKQAIYERVLQVLNSEAIFQPEFSLDTMARITDTKCHHLSQIMGEMFKKNFNSVLAEWRIREACRRLSDVEHYGNYTIEAIGTSLGFNSRSYFSVCFKKQTGLTPGEYIKLSRKRIGRPVKIE